METNANKTRNLTLMTNKGKYVDLSILLYYASLSLARSCTEIILD